MNPVLVRRALHSAVASPDTAVGCLDQTGHMDCSWDGRAVPGRVEIAETGLDWMDQACEVDNHWQQASTIVESWAGSD